MTFYQLFNIFLLYYFQINPNNNGENNLPNKILPSHPKMEHLQKIIVEHFKKFEEKGQSTRVMIFSQVSY